MVDNSRKGKLYSRARTNALWVLVIGTSYVLLKERKFGSCHIVFSIRVFIAHHTYGGWNCSHICQFAITVDRGSICVGTGNSILYCVPIGIRYGKPIGR